MELWGDLLIDREREFGRPGGGCGTGRGLGGGDGCGLGSRGAG